MLIEGYYIDLTDENKSFNLEFLNKFKDQILLINEIDSLISISTASAKINYSTWPNYRYIYDSSNKSILFNKVRNISFSTIHNIIVEIKSTEINIESLSNTLLFLKSSCKKLNVNTIHTCLIYLHEDTDFQYGDITGKTEIIRYSI